MKGLVTQALKGNWSGCLKGEMGWLPFSWLIFATCWLWYLTLQWGPGGEEIRQWASAASTLWMTQMNSYGSTFSDGALWWGGRPSPQGSLSAAHMAELVPPPGLDFSLALDHPTDSALGWGNMHLYLKTNAWTPFPHASVSLQLSNWPTRSRQNFLSFSPG